MPDSTPWITGIAPHYNDEYDKDILGPYISKKAFQTVMKRINDTLFNYWPCGYCFWGTGYMFGILTCGLSCLIPGKCVMDSRKAMKVQLVKLNKFLKDKHLRFEFVERCPCRSYFNVYLNEPEDPVGEL